MDFPFGWRRRRNERRQAGKDRVAGDFGADNQVVFDFIPMFAETMLPIANDFDHYLRPGQATLTHEQRYAAAETALRYYRSHEAVLKSTSFAIEPGLTRAGYEFRDAAGNWLEGTWAMHEAIEHLQRIVEDTVS